MIGAGASGVAAASKLVKSYRFKDVTILEAEKRFGGHINTIPFENNVLNLEAQWFGLFVLFSEFYLKKFLILYKMMSIQLNVQVLR